MSLISGIGKENARNILKTIRATLAAVILVPILLSLNIFNEALDT